MIRGAALAAFASLATLAACGIDLGPAQPWESVNQAGVDATMQAEISAPDTFRAARLVATEPVRVVSYNTEFGQDPEGLAATLLGNPELARAGIFLIQEEESYPDEPESRAATLARLLGLGYIYVPAREKLGGTHGLALMSAFPIDHVERMLLPLADNGVPRMALSADVHIGDKTLHVINIHLETRLNAGDRVAQLHPSVIDAPDAVLVAGDFNTNWVTWAGKLPVLAEENDQVPILDSYMASLGFEAPSKDWGPTEHRFGLEFKLDSIYTRGLETTGGGVVRSGPSDHWPMYIDVHL